MRFLLDANVFIALTVQDHVHHEIARRWRQHVERWAVCPIVEGSLIRYLLRNGETGRTAGQIVDRVRVMSGCEFWSDDLSYLDINLTALRGHRQVTDAYLAGLAAAHGGRLATMDRALARLYPAQTELIPTS